MSESGVELPRTVQSPFRQVWRRMVIAAGVLVATVLIVYFDRNGYRDNSGGPLSLLDATYYATVSLSTTGYGDITPVTPGARLLNILDNPTRRLVLCAFRHAADRHDVAVYAFGGDLSPLVDGAKPALRFWPVGELDVYDRPAVRSSPRLQTAGSAR